MMARQPLFYGWRVVAAAFSVAVFAWGMGFYGPPVFLQALHVERGWSIAAISAAISAHFIVSAACVAWLSDAHRRFGIAAVTRAGVAALAGGVLAWALSREPWHLFAAAAISGAGWAATSGAAINAMVAPWFDRQRPAALAMAFNGASFGGILFVPLWVALMVKLGLVGAATVVGAAMVVVLWPVIGQFLSRTPESLGLAPDGYARAADATARERPRVAPISRATLLLDRRFVTMSVGFALALFAQIGLVAHLLAMLSPRLGDAGAAAAMSLSTVAAIAGRTLLGWLLGARDRRIAAAANFLVQACGVALIALPAGGPAVPVAGCLLFGLGIGNLISLPPLIVQAEFARADVPRVVALSVAVGQSVFAFAPGVFGALHDAMGTYLAPLVLAVAVQVAAAALVLAGRGLTSDSSEP